MNHDLVTRTGSLGHNYATPADAGTRNCMPCGQHKSQRGGRQFRWHGVNAVWHCAACAAVRLAKRG